MTTQDEPIKRLNATLPLQLAQFVGEITGKNGLYETPSEFVRDLIRRYMEKTVVEEKVAMNDLLRHSMADNKYSPLTAEDARNIRDSVI